MASRDTQSTDRPFLRASDSAGAPAAALRLGTGPNTGPTPNGGHPPCWSTERSPRRIGLPSPAGVSLNGHRGARAGSLFASSFPAQGRATLLALTLGVLSAAGNALAGAPPFISIGSDPACILSPNAPGGAIAVALGAGTSDIRLVGGEEYVGQFALPGRNVSIRGGYLNCTDAAADVLPPEPEKSVLRPADFEPWVFQFNGGSERVTSRLQHVALRPSPTPAARVGKGLFAQTSNAELELFDSDITGFEQQGDAQGGAALVVNGASLTLVRSRLSQNRASSGGAIACVGAGFGKLLVDEGSELLENQATNGNGGAILASGCEVYIQSRAGGGGLGISYNSATGNGGAIHAVNGQIIVQGGPVCSIPSNDLSTLCASSELALFDGNIALGDGGAISLSATTTTAFAIIDFARFRNNRSGVGRQGGALHLSSSEPGLVKANIGTGLFGTVVPTPAQREASCRHPSFVAMTGHCVFFDGNHAGNWVTDLPEPGAAAAIAAVDAEVVLRDAMLFSNYAQDGVLLARGLRAVLDIEQSVLLGDVRGESAIQLEDRARATIRQSFIESDSDLGPTLRVEDAQLGLHNSYISHALSGGTALSANGGALVSGACNAVTGAESGATVPGIVVEREEVGGFLPVPVAGSRLIDRCVPGDLTPAIDIIGNPRVRAVDAAGTAAPLDIGPYEFQPPESEALFADGFEEIIPN